MAAAGLGTQAAKKVLLNEHSITFHFSHHLQSNYTGSGYTEGYVLRIQMNPQVTIAINNTEQNGGNIGSAISSINDG